MKKTFAKIFIVIEMAMLGLVLFSMIYYHSSLRFYLDHARHAPEEPYLMYGEEDYPQTMEYEEYRGQAIEHIYRTAEERGFADKVDDLADYTDWYNVISTGSGSSNSSGRIRALENALENYTNSEKILGKMNFVLLKKKLDKFVGLDMTSSLSGGQNDIWDVRDLVGPTADGQLGWIQDDANMTERIQNTIDFGLTMQEQGRNFVLFENPNKYAEIPGIVDYSEKKYDKLHTALEAFDVDYIDVGAKMHDMGMTDSDIFFHSDFHWKPWSGIVADQILCEYLNEKADYGVDTSIFNRENYQVETLVNRFLGYLGKKVTEEYADPDDFDIITPKFETDYTVFNTLDMSEKRGSLEDTLFWKEQLEVDSLYEGNLYDMYGYGDQCLIKVHNNLNENGKRMLVVKESYANVMTPYLAGAVEDLDIIDLRGFKGSLMSYIEETNPDTVVLVYGLSSFGEFGVFDAMFDYR
ncbi:MAG: DHHW family protein [Dorea sp.]|nr:DHHW family protein [Dorea sp.]